jgi:tetratricopeptide (TPR) repeat protein
MSERRISMRATNVLCLCLSLNLAFCASAEVKQRKAQEKDPKYQYNVGLFYLNQNNVDEGIKYFQKTIVLSSRYHLAWNALGLAYSMKGDFDKSVKAFEKCLEINPLFTEARNNLGTVYQEMNALDKAEAEFQRALLDQNYTNRELPYFNLARLYVLQGRLDEALQSAQTAVQIQPRLAMAHNLRGFVLEKLGNIEGAISAYELAVRIVPDDILFNYNLGVAYFNNQEYDKAKETFLKISPKVIDMEMKDNISRYLKIIGQRGPGVV